MTDGRRAAVFLDRDGTIVEDPGYLHEPEKVRLLPGAAEAIARLNAAGYLVITVSNQSGIARGLYKDADYVAVQQRLGELLAAQGAHLDGAYYCPHHPQFNGTCECRKPKTKLFHDAEAELGVELPRSWWVGDRLTDVKPARGLGGRRRAFLVTTGQGTLHQGQARALGVAVVPDLAAAADAILKTPP
ncbi:MAG TPA: HAD family hydrolase [Gemmatimonadales bacterium]|jgi:D-glycero-D-manno-heptose 1,7-bisphosphate phosphatase